MRIGVVVEYLHARGGTQRQALELARSLAVSGHDVTVLTRVLDRGRCFPELVNQVDVRAVREADGAHPVAQTRPLRSMARRITGALGVHDAVALRAMHRASAELEKLVGDTARERPFDVLNAHDYGPAAWSLGRASTTTATVWQCNDPLFRWERARGCLGAPTRKMVLAHDRARCAHFDAVTVLDNTVARVVRERLGVEPIVVRSGVSPQTFVDLPPRLAARQRMGVAANAFVVLVLTLLNSRHRRAEDGIAVARRLAGSDCVLLAATITDPTSDYVGELETSAATPDAAAHLVWRRAPLSGDAELRDLFAAADVFLFPNTQQTWGLAVIEACMAGLPVVVSNGAGVHEVITDGVDGFVYPATDVAAAYRHIERLRCDSELRRRMGAAARALAGSYSWDRYATRMLAVFDDALARRGGA